MPYFVKKPIVLEARQVCSQQGHAVAEWCGGRYDDVVHQITVPSLEGDHTGASGDWVVKGTRGEFLVVRRDIFEETYEPAAALVSSDEDQIRQAMAEAQANPGRVGRAGG